MSISYTREIDEVDAEALGQRPRQLVVAKRRPAPAASGPVGTPWIASQLDRSLDHLAPGVSEVDDHVANQLLGAPRCAGGVRPRG